MTIDEFKKKVLTLPKKNWKSYEEAKQIYLSNYCSFTYDDAVDAAVEILEL